jgi:hypothetical protein
LRNPFLCLAAAVLLVSVGLAAPGGDHSARNVLEAGGEASYSFPASQGVPRIPAGVGPQGVQGPGVPLTSLGAPAGDTAAHAFAGAQPGATGPAYAVDLTVLNGTVSSSSAAVGQRATLTDVTTNASLNVRTGAAGQADFSVPAGYYLLTVQPSSSSYIQFEYVLDVSAALSRSFYLLPVADSVVAVNNGGVSGKVYISAGFNTYVPGTTSNPNLNELPQISIQLLNASNGDALLATSVTGDNGTAEFTGVSASYSYLANIVGYSQPLSGVLYAMMNDSLADGKAVGPFTVSGHETLTQNLYVGLTSGNATLTGAANGYSNLDGLSSVRGGVETLSSYVDSTGNLAIVGSTVYLNCTTVPGTTWGIQVANLYINDSVVYVLGTVIRAANLYVSASSLIFSSYLTYSRGVTSLLGYSSGSTGNLYVADSGIAYGYVQVVTVADETVSVAQSSLFDVELWGMARTNVSDSVLSYEAMDNMTALLDFTAAYGNVTLYSDYVDPIDSFSAPYSSALARFQLFNDSSLSRCYLNSTFQVIVYGNGVSLTHDVFQNDTDHQDGAIQIPSVGELPYFETHAIAGLQIANDTFGAVYMPSAAWDSFFGQVEGGQAWISAYSVGTTAEAAVYDDAFYMVGGENSNGYEAVDVWGFWQLVGQDVFYNNESWGPQAYLNPVAEAQFVDVEPGIPQTGAVLGVKTETVAGDWFLNLNNRTVPIAPMGPTNRARAGYTTVSASGDRLFYHTIAQAPTLVAWPFPGDLPVFAVPQPVANYTFSFGSLEPQLVYNSTSELSLVSNSETLNAWEWVVAADANTSSGSLAVGYANGLQAGPQPPILWRGFNYSEEVEPSYVEVGANSTSAPAITVQFPGNAFGVYDVLGISGNVTVYSGTAIASEAGVVSATYAPAADGLSAVFVVNFTGAFSYPPSGDVSWASSIWGLPLVAWIGLAGVLVAVGVGIELGRRKR